MSTSSNLSWQVATIFDSLRDLPGRKDISIKTKRYPRLLQSEAAVGFEQREWRFARDDHPRDVPIPPDAEDVIVTWRGACASKQEIGLAIENALAQLSTAGTNWDFEMTTRRNGDVEPDLIVEVYRSFSGLGN